MTKSMPSNEEEPRDRGAAGEPGILVLRALGALLAYPDGSLRAALPEIAAAVRGSELILPSDRDEVLALIDDIAAADPLEAEERYVERFDRGRSTSLHLFEHVHGEARDRGQAMVELQALYGRAGFELAAKELPDYLPVVLEYLSCRSLTEAREFLGECAHILRSLGEALLAQKSRYAAVPGALLGLTGSAGLALQAAAHAPQPEDLDREWREQPAFGPDSQSWPPAAAATTTTSQEPARG